MEKDWNVFVGTYLRKRSVSTKTFSSRFPALNELEKKS